MCLAFSGGILGSLRKWHLEMLPVVSSTQIIIANAFIVYHKVLPGEGPVVFHLTFQHFIMKTFQHAEELKRIVQ